MGRIPEPMSPSVERYGLSYIRPYHREIARRLVLGEKASSVCLDLNMSPSRMSIIINSPLFKLELRRLEQARDADTVDVTKTLRELSPVALEVVERTMYMAKSESLRFNAAQDVLDRAGVAKVSKLVGQVIHDYASMSDEELKLRKEELIAKEIGTFKRRDSGARQFAEGMEDEDSSESP